MILLFQKSEIVYFITHLLAIYLYLLKEIIHTTHTHTIIYKCSLFTTISFPFHLEIFVLAHLLFAYNLSSGIFLDGE